ncbi:MAG: polysaccharide deacetylase family sporulation protein PdaB [Peptococcaceae bacterium]|nr:polysaccharide deacetylase family sporulation protein PdaB [Peptococcaceae bacterium]
MKKFFRDHKNTKYFLISALILIGLGVAAFAVLKASNPSLISEIAKSADSEVETVDLSPSSDGPKAELVKEEQSPISTSPVLVTEQNEENQAVYKVRTNRKVAALTFDISWGTKVPGPVIDILDRYNVKSTFFLSGPWVEGYPSFPKRLVEDGHEIASHGNRHIDLDKETGETIKEEIEKAHASIKKVTGIEPGLIRVPNGAYNDLVLDVADQLGYRVIQWSDDSLDWKNPGVDNIVTRVLDRVHPGAIILMHASDTCLQTPEALPKVLDGLREMGYELVTVSQLLEEGPGVIN